MISMSTNLTHHPTTKLTRYLRDTEFFRALGPMKAALISGIFTTFEYTRFTGVELFRGNDQALLKIASTSKYGSVRTMASDELSDRWTTLKPTEIRLVAENLSHEKLLRISDSASINVLQTLAQSQMSKVSSAAVSQFLKRRKYSDLVALYDRRTSLGSCVLAGLSSVLDNLSDNPALTLLATAHPEVQIRKTAISRLSDAQSTIHIAASLDHPDLVSAAIDKLSEEHRVAVYERTKSDITKKLVVDRLGSDLTELSTTPSLRLVDLLHPDKAIRLLAIAKIKDHSTILEISNAGQDQVEVVQAVIVKLSDPEKVGVYYKTASDAVRALILDDLASLLGTTIDQNVLAVLSEHGDSSVRVRAISKLNSEDALSSIVTRSKYPDAVSSAIKRLSPNALWLLYPKVPKTTKDQIDARFVQTISEISNEGILLHLAKLFTEKIPVRVRSKKGMCFTKLLNQLVLLD